VYQDDPLTPQIAARQISDWVRGALPALDSVAVRDTNDRLLCAAFGRAYRCFESILELASRSEADDARILSRALLSTALRSLWLVAPDDQRERELRVGRATMSYLKELRKMVADEEAASVVSDVDTTRLTDIIHMLEAEGVAALPNDHDLAVSLNLKPFYTRVYRPGSDTAHYSIDTALDGFLELTNSDQIGRVAVGPPSSADAEEVLINAQLTYALFLHRCDPIIAHGLSKRVRNLLEALLGSQPGEPRANTT